MSAAGPTGWCRSDEASSSRAAGGDRAERNEHRDPFPPQHLDVGLGAVAGQPGGEPPERDADAEQGQHRGRAAPSRCSRSARQKSTVPRVIATIGRTGRPPVRRDLDTTAMATVASSTSASGCRAEDSADVAPPSRPGRTSSAAGTASARPAAAASRPVRRAPREVSLGAGRSHRAPATTAVSTRCAGRSAPPAAPGPPRATQTTRPGQAAASTSQGRRSLPVLTRTRRSRASSATADTATTASVPSGPATAPRVAAGSATEAAVPSATCPRTTATPPGSLGSGSSCPVHRHGTARDESHERSQPRRRSSVLSRFGRWRFSAGRRRAPA